MNFSKNVYFGYFYRIVSLCDTMLAVADQSKWLDDSTNIQIASHGVSESNNIHATDLGWNLDPMYINKLIEIKKSISILYPNIN